MFSRRSWISGTCLLFCRCIFKNFLRLFLDWQVEFTWIKLLPLENRNWVLDQSYNEKNFLHIAGLAYRILTMRILNLCAKFASRCESISCVILKLFQRFTLSLFKFIVMGIVQGLGTNKFSFKWKKMIWITNSLLERIKYKVQCNILVKRIANATGNET